MQRKYKIDDIGIKTFELRIHSCYEILLNPYGSAITTAINYLSNFKKIENIYIKN